GGTESTAKANKGTAPQLNLTETGKTLGTPQYMAPEQIEHPQDVDQRADIYSLGVVFYEMLTGELPIGRFAPPSEKSAVDPRVDEVVLRTLEKERTRRTQSAGQVKTQVETITSTPQRQKTEDVAQETISVSPSGTAGGISGWTMAAWSAILCGSAFFIDLLFKIPSVLDSLGISPKHLVSIYMLLNYFFPVLVAL